MPSILLTGANGFVAVTVLKTLLDKGYTVVGTVRTESKTNFLREKFSSSVNNGTLKFAVVPDITVPGAFDEVLKEYRFDAVVHTSSPFYLTAKDIQTEMLDPPIKGTTGILESVFKLAPTVKRIVITATFANIQSIPKGDWPGGTYTDEDWSPVKLDEVSRNHPILGYVAGKLYAEKAAFDFVKEKSPNFSVTTLCPPMHYPERAAAKSVKKGNPGRLYPDTGVFSIDNSKSIRDLGIFYNDFNSMMKDTLKKLEELEMEGK
ncbi:methylglyoxal reductase (NADPH-dependent) gre2 [Tulasnella sp. UAMH 9824]|nr:methylglyoxal reductase (NADPH-dependent) gre2 [Tulasnella sp. UAMH 9824]